MDKLRAAMADPDAVFAQFDEIVKPVVGLLHQANLHAQRSKTATTEFQLAMAEALMILLAAKQLKAAEPQVAVAAIFLAEQLAARVALLGSAPLVKRGIAGFDGNRRARTASSKILPQLPALRAEWKLAHASGQKVDSFRRAVEKRTKGAITAASLRRYIKTPKPK